MVSLARASRRRFAGGVAGDDARGSGNTEDLEEARNTPGSSRSSVAVRPRNIDIPLSHSGRLQKGRPSVVSIVQVSERIIHG